MHYCRDAFGLCPCLQYCALGWNKLNYITLLQITIQLSWSPVSRGSNLKLELTKYSFFCEIVQSLDLVVLLLCLQWNEMWGESVSPVLLFFFYIVLIFIQGIQPSGSTNCHRSPSARTATNSRVHRLGQLTACIKITHRKQVSNKCNLIVMESVIINKSKCYFLYIKWN